MALHLGFNRMYTWAGSAWNVLALLEGKYAVFPELCALRYQINWGREVMGNMG